MKKYVLLIVTIVLALPLAAQIESSSVGAEENAMGKCDLSYYNPYAVSNNPAMLSDRKAWGVGVYSERRFLLSPLSHHQASFFMSKKWGAIGAAVEYQGDGVYSQSQVSLAYARKISDRINVGVGFYTDMYQTKDMESIRTINGQVGLYYKLIDKLHLAATLKNPFPQKLDAHDVPMQGAVGLNFIPSEKVQFRAEGHFSTAHAADFRLGLNYQPIQILSLQIGYLSYPSSITGGFGLSFSNFKLNLFAQTHNQLKITPGLSLSFYKKEK